MSDVTKLATLAVLTELVAGCPPGGTGASATCTVDAAPRTATSTSALIGGDSTCPDFGCGANSPTIADGVAFDELEPNGVPDRHGIRIIAGTQGGRPVRLRVDRHSISAFATDGSGVVFTRGGVVGTVITLQKEAMVYDLRIDGIDENSLRFWAGDTTEIVPFYRILVRVPPEQSFKTPVCRQNIARTEPWWTPVEHSAIAFAGDRYDPVHKLVSDTPPGTLWFNLACAGSATAKLHLTRHTNAGAWTASTWRPGLDIAHPGAPFHTPVAARQAMLKMYAADYCGNGKAYTVDGQPLLYDVTNPLYRPPGGVPQLVVTGGGTLSPPTATLEAVWGDHGALCLERPRRPDLWDGACSPPPCGGPAGVIGWQTRAHALSAGWCPP